MIAEFDKTNFDRVLAGAISLLPRQFRKGAGLIRATDYNDLLDSASIEAHNLRDQQALLRLLSGVGLVHKHRRYLEKGSNLSMNTDQDRVILDRLLLDCCITISRIAR